MKYEMYRDNRLEWRWRLKAANHEIIAVSSESYRNKQDCLYSIALTKGSADAPVYEI